MISTLIISESGLGSCSFLTICVSTDYELVANANAYESRTSHLA